MRDRLVRACALAIGLCVPLMGASAARAHQHRPVAGFETTVGWVEEPAFAGFRNAVQFLVSEEPAAGEDEGDPVEGAKLKVEVIFGERDSTTKTEAMDLTPAFGSPGEYRAFLVPSRPGTYTFHITGSFGKKEIDEFYTSGEKGAVKGSEGTFNDVRDPGEVEFPQRDATRGELSERTQRMDARLAAVQSATADADDSAGLATMLAVLGLVLGALALGVAIVRRKGAGA